MQKCTSFLVILLFLLNLNTSFGQDTSLSSDELLLKARTAAFDQKDYPTSVGLLKQALSKSPNYTDVAVFLGRIYTWSDQVDSARVVFDGLLQRGEQDEDFYLAYASLEYWNDQEKKALDLIEKGLVYTPTSELLQMLAARINYGLEDYAKAEQYLTHILQVNPKQTEARELASKIRDLTTLNGIGVNYNLVHFDKQFADNWHIVGVSYKRRTNFGSVIARVNYANKFADNGVQFEAEAYPRLSKTFYMYVGAGYSNNVGIFPKFRTGASLYANLPKSFEGEVGFRQLYFSDNLFMYTGSVGKYYQNFWFNVRTFITPSNQNISHSYTGTVRYYTKGANDYIGFQFGTGISPEDNRNNLLDLNTYKMKTFKLGIDYNFAINKRNLFSIGATYFNQEYLPMTRGNQFDLSIGLVRNF